MPAGKFTHGGKVTFSIAGVRELVSTVLSHFGRFPLRSKKQADFAIWEKAVLLQYEISRRRFRSRGLHMGMFPKRTLEDISKYASMAEQIREVREYRSDNGYVADLLGDRDQSGHWISGFVDGEGCFRLRMRSIGTKTRSKVVRNYPGCGFAVTLRADDLPIIEAIRNRWGGIGTIKIQRHANEKWGDQATFAVWSIEDIYKVVLPHFVAYPLRAKKSRDFTIWKQAVCLCHRVKQRSFLGLNGRGGTQPKWTTEDFAQFQSFHAKLAEVRRFKSGRL
jgi:hypothetical protein